jgi:hypothetical protein
MYVTVICRWLKRSEVTTSIRIFSDPQLEFMTAYDLIDDESNHRWNISMLIFNTKGTKPRVIRDVDPSYATQLAIETIADYSTNEHA